MRVVGIDPGLERIGWGCIDKRGSRLELQGFGLIQSPRIALPERLKMIHDEVEALFTRFKPDVLATERQLFAANKTTAFDVAKSLGVVLLATADRGLEWHEYSPPEIKLSVVGVGNADKKQVQYMVAKLLGLKEMPKPDDVADALAVAITHCFRTSKAFR